MKTSLKKLRGFGLQRHQGKEHHRLQHSPAHLDELSQASQDMLDMRDCYESLLSAAAATANSAFEFSESLKEMGDCLLEKTAMNDDEESAKVLLMLGKVHFELQKFVDRYRAHIFQTISAPSESLLNELCIVEEMKRQCDEKRNEYEDMIARQKEKGWLRSSSKGETFSSQQLQAAHDEYDEEATLFVFRMKSLKRGRSQSLLTQAARHHAAQLCFFRKSLKSLEAIEPHVKLVTARQHIDYQFTGLEDDDDGDYGDNDVDSDDDDDDYETDSGDGCEVHDDGELSFADGQSDQGQDASKSRSSMELDKVDLTFPKGAVENAAKENLYGNPAGYSFGFGGEHKTSSKSAPLSAEKKFDPAERFKQMRQSSSRKLQTYVLPTPIEKGTNYSGSINQVPQSRIRLKQSTHNLWHSSPLEHKKVEDIFGNDKLSGPILTQSILKRSNYNTTTSRLTPPLMTEGLSSPQHSVSVHKKIKRQAFSGPLTGKSWPSSPILSASGPILSTGNPQMFSGPLLRGPMPSSSSSATTTTSQNISSSASSAFVSSPKISELHELPRPPLPPQLATKRPSNNLIRHSAPLLPKAQDLSPTSKAAMVVSNASSSSSMLPLPPHTVPRSYSVQASSKNLKINRDIASPPLIPINLSNS